MGREFSTLRYAVDQRVAVITFIRPDRRNAFTTSMALDVVEAMDLADADDDVRAVVVTGQGHSFCAGSDLDVADPAEASALARLHERAGDFGDVPRDVGGVVALRFAASRKPLIGALNGSAIGVGITMTLPMDVRVLADDAKVGFVFVRHGRVPGAASTWFLPRLVGISKAVEWCTTGRLVTPEEALAAGLVSYVLPSADVLPRALEIARDVADHASSAAASTARHLLWSMLDVGDPVIAHRMESEAIAALAARSDVVPEHVPRWPPTHLFEAPTEGV